ncbi:MAG: TorF family putative porin [Woeseiaceae bacterium]|nr:TorF family putative porin [Woeseiaceae bacterium]
MLCAGSLSQAAEFTGYAVLTTDYVFRGVSYSDSHAAAQLGGEIGFDNGFYAGAWASTVDLSSGPEQQRDLEVDYYAGYGFDVTRKWNVGANVVSYNFPGTEGAFDYDYIEYSISSNYADRVWLEYSYSPDIFNTGIETHNFELYGEWQPGGDIVIGGGAGFYDVSDLSGSGYSYWQLGVTHPISIADVDLRYFDTSDWAPIISRPDQADARIVLSLRFQF